MTSKKLGRPLAFDSVEELEKKVEDYFVSEDCYLTQGDEQNTEITEYYKQTKTFIEEELKNTFFIPTYEPLIKYYQKYTSTKETEFLFPNYDHATDFGSKKLSKHIGMSIKKIGWD